MNVTTRLRMTIADYFRFKATNGSMFPDTKTKNRYCNAICGAARSARLSVTILTGYIILASREEFRAYHRKNWRTGKAYGPGDPLPMPSRDKDA